MTASPVTRRIFGREALVVLMTAAVAMATSDLLSAQDAASAAEVKIRNVIKQRLPGEPVRDLLLTEVTYPPGSASPPHLHAQGVMAFVVSGSIASKVGNDPEKVYRAGEAWWEPPGAFHRVSRNAGTSEPAKLLAIFIASEDAKPDDLYKPI